jgi:hypothetical protein
MEERRVPVAGELEGSAVGIMVDSPEGLSINGEHAERQTLRSELVLAVHVTNLDREDGCEIIRIEVRIDVIESRAGDTSSDTARFEGVRNGNESAESLEVSGGAATDKEPPKCEINKRVEIASLSAVVSHIRDVLTEECVHERESFICVRLDSGTNGKGVHKCS